MRALHSVDITLTRIAEAWIRKPCAVKRAKFLILLELTIYILRNILFGYGRRTAIVQCLCIELTLIGIRNVCCCLILITYVMTILHPTSEGYEEVFRTTTLKIHNRLEDL